MVKMKRLIKLERRILIYLDSEEPFSSIEQISHELKVERWKVKAALEKLKKLKLVIEEGGLWAPSEEYEGV